MQQRALGAPHPTSAVARPALRTAVVAATALVWTGLSCGPGIAAAGSQVSCGSVLTTSTTLTRDLTGCPGDGLVLAADGISLDLNGHAISGDSVPNADGFDVGIRAEGRYRVRIRDGSVTGFDRGVLLVGSPDATLTGLQVHDNSNRGVMLDAGSDDATLTANRVTDNGASGLAIVASDGARVRGNQSLRNTGGSGLRLDASSFAEVFDNIFSDNLTGASAVNGANANRVRHNRFTGNLEGGVVIEFADANVVAENVMTANGSGVILESANDTVITGNRITHNLAELCEGCGIGIQIYGDRSLVARNIVIDSPRYGIEVDDFGDVGHSPAVDTVLRDNLVDVSGIGIAIGPEAGGVLLRTRIVRNVVTHAQSDGIQLLGPTTGLETSTVTRNTTNDNGGFGIVAVPGVIDGGGNRAAGNGNPMQCSNVTCR